MISYRKKFYFWKLRDNLFVYRFRFADIFSLVQYSYVKRFESKPRFCFRDISYTVEIPINRPYEEIFSSFRNTYRNNIRNAEKEGVICHFRDDLDTFLSYYNDFAKQKNLFPARRDMLEELGTHFKTGFAELNGQILAAHSYLVDEETGMVRIYHIASSRLLPGIDAKVVGNANKMLIAEGIRFFQQKNYSVFDLGGYAEGTNDKGLQGINEWKLSFGGTKVMNENYQSPIYYLLRKLSLLLDRRYR